MNTTTLADPGGESGIRTGTSHCSQAADAAHELAALLAPSAGGLALVFASSRFASNELADGLRDAFGDTPLIGCTTAGEIGPEGYQEGSLTGAAFGPGDIDFEIGLLEDLDQTDTRAMTGFAHALRHRLQARHPGLGSETFLAFMLVDGLCAREESIARAFHDGLGGIPLSGGSAGDELNFAETRVIFNGRLVENAAVLLVATTTRPFTVFKTQHFTPTMTRLVVTGAIPEKRIVTEINGCPAAPEYARALGIDPASLTPQTFAAHPVVVRIGNADFVRSIQRANPDGSLSFFCAIDRGIVFKVAHGEDLLANLDTALVDAGTQVGEVALTLGCDCILRRLECRERGITEQVGQRLAHSRVIGFSTFGEQYRGMHINQTFTGIAFGRRARS
ncbi:MAG: FIST N-terminal domain-containing protein [Zoogloea oleivorans]|jgi:hypothetical protein|uniref:FIST domain containing protein n=1 Tax=Zoogloea oleivorans TaxID=1552750 RepID=A0A6C2CQ48_9RHOO|nr:FIST N-terminal domain-containing protein [Zoogloea oleivorans]MBT9496677.1 FIST C-terminal domain-containing protein [Zoogloea sp.]MDY0035353.1 FIST N-terminal domain-containing protein [Zoogloea oleivorans]TYC56257.1 FIST domain containing protein [Zoogloea oleivorans]